MVAYPTEGNSDLLTCDLFELRLALTGGDCPKVEYLFYTDLPAGPVVIISCYRTYENMRGEKCVWAGYDGKRELIPNAHGDFSGGKDIVDVYNSDKQGFEFFNALSSSFSAGIKTRVSDEFIVSITLGGRQRLRAFGKNNSGMNGQMVSKAGEINVVQVSANIVVPMAEEFQPLSQ